jgi:hypothetical protein
MIQQNNLAPSGFHLAAVPRSPALRTNAHSSRLDVTGIAPLGPAPATRAEGDITDGEFVAGGASTQPLRCTLLRWGASLLTRGAAWAGDRDFA